MDASTATRRVDLAGYPLSHHGWAAVLDDLALDHDDTDVGHVPLRWRLLVHYRDSGATFSEIGRLLGLSERAAVYGYLRWARRVCCPTEATRKVRGDE